MNRPGQPPQRPPSLGPNPGLPGGPFRASPYPPPYGGMPPRNVNVFQGGLGIQPRASSQQQSLVPGALSPGYIQQRTPGSFPFGGIGQQTASGQQQHPSSTTPGLQQHSSQQQANGASVGLPPHLSQRATTPSLGGGAPSASSATGEGGLDMKDFPALGSSAPTNTSNSGNGGAGASYASQAGTGANASAVGSAGTGGGTTNGNQPRDFTPDDFPALGGQSQTSSQNQDPQSHPHSQPPGLNGNGFDHSTHRQNILGSIQQPSGTPGMLNIGAHARNVHPGFQQQGQSEAEKQRNNYALKLNQATHAAWNSPNTNSGGQTQIGSGTFPSSNATISQTNGTHNPSAPQNNASQQHLNAPPGVPPPTTTPGAFNQPPQHGPGAIANAANANTSATAAPGAQYITNGMGGGPAASIEPHNHYPQTPAQQILMSAADRWGLLGLLAMIKNVGSEVDGGLSSVGTDLGTMGLDVGHSGNLYSTFITPWADQSAAHTVEPDFHLPTCYNVQPPPPGPGKAAAFSDETLFFMFYSSPRDALQEVAAQELFNRNWRYHKELRHWITKETGTAPSQKVPGGETGSYTFWDPENWQKERKDMTVLYVDLEEKAIPAFQPGPGLVPSNVAHPQSQTIAPAPTQQQQQQRGSFSMGMSGL